MTVRSLTAPLPVRNGNLERWIRTDIVYLCTHATLMAIYHHNSRSARVNPSPSNTTGAPTDSFTPSPIRKVLIFGFGHGVGGISDEKVADQMVLACNFFVKGLLNKLHGDQADSEGRGQGGEWKGLTWNQAGEWGSAVKASARLDVQDKLEP